MIATFRFSRGLLIFILLYWVVAVRHFFVRNAYNRAPSKRIRLLNLAPKMTTEKLSSYDPLEVRAMLQRLSSEAAPSSNRPRSHSLSQPERSRVLQQLSRCIEMSEPQLLADCMWRIGSLGFSVRDDEVLFSDSDSIVPRVLARASAVLRDSVDPHRVMDNVAISKLFIGLARLQVSLDHVNVPLDKGGDDSEDPFVLLVEIFRTTLPSLGAQSLSNTLWALTEMGVRRPHLSPALRRAILERIHALTSSLSDQGLSMTLWSLFKLGYSWPNIPEAVRSVLLSSMAKLCVRMSSQAVGNSLYALGRMGLRYEALSDANRVALEIAVRHSLQVAHDQDLMQTTQGLALMHVPWSALSAHTRHSLSMALFTRAKTWLQRGSFGSVVEYSTLLQSLGQLGVRWTDCDPALRAGLLLGLTAVTDLNGGANSTDPTLAHLNSDKDSFVKIEKLKYGVLQNLASRANNTREGTRIAASKSLNDASGTPTESLQLAVFDSADEASHLRATYSMAVPNIWRGLANLGVSLRESDLDSAMSADERHSSKLLLAIPAPILRRFFTLTAVFASDLSLQGLSMLSAALVDLNARAPALTSSASRRKSLVPRLVAVEVAQRTLQLLDQSTREYPAGIVDETSMRSLSNVILCAGKLGFRLSDGGTLARRFERGLLQFYEQQYQETRLPIGDKELVSSTALSESSTGKSLESLLATLNSYASVRGDWSAIPHELKLAAWTSIHSTLQLIKSAPLSESLLTELELVSSVLWTLGSLGAEWRSMMSHDSFTRSTRRHSITGASLQGQLEMSSFTQSLLVSFVDTCLAFTNSNLARDRQSQEYDGASRVAVLLLRALCGIGYNYDETTSTDLPALTQILEFLFSVFSSDQEVDISMFSVALYYLGKSQPLQALPELQKSQLGQLASQLLVQQYGKVSYQVLSNFFTGIKGLNFRWSELPPSLQTACLARLAYLAASPSNAGDSAGLVACISALAATDMTTTVEGFRCELTSDRELTKTMHSLVMRSSALLADEDTNSPTLRAYLHVNLHRYALRQVASNPDMFSALECRLFLRACCTLRWASQMTKPLKLLLLQTVCDDMHESIVRRATLANDFSVKLSKLDEDLVSPFAFTKLCVELGEISWTDLSSAQRSKLLQSVADFARVGGDGAEAASYSQFRSFLRRLEALGAVWSTLASVHSSLPFERFFVTEGYRHLHSSTGEAVSSISTPLSTRRYNTEVSVPKYDFRVASDILGWASQMHCRHADLLELDSVMPAPGVILSDLLVQTPCDAVLSIPVFATLSTHSTNKVARVESASGSAVVADERALHKFADLLDSLLVLDIQWPRLGQTGQRALLRLVHLSVLLALHNVESDAMCDASATSISLCDQAVRLLLSLRVRWSDLPTRPRNLLSSALAEVFLAHQAQLIAFLALENRLVTVGDSEGEETRRTAATKMQQKIEKLGTLVHLMQTILQHLHVTNQTVTKELRQFL